MRCEELLEFPKNQIEIVHLKAILAELKVNPAKSYKAASNDLIDMMLLNG